jgi:hypothetical protein
VSFQLVDYGSYNQDLLDSVEDMVAVLDEPDQDVLFDQSDSYVAVVGPDLRFYQTPGGVWRISDRYVVETGWTKDQLGGADWRDWFDPSGSVSALGALGAAGLRSYSSRRDSVRRAETTCIL